MAARLPGRLLRAEFFLRSPEIVAQDLLGKLLLRIQPDGAVLAGRIVETEAYIGADDPASHAYRGKTTRNAAMFGPPGCAYVYFIYGMHYCMNAVCGPEGHAGAVLLRALEPVRGRDRMAMLRHHDASVNDKLLTGGPARLAEALDITRARDDGKNLLSPKSDLQLRDDGYVSAAVEASRRIGITKAAERELRFSLVGNPCVSR